MVIGSGATAMSLIPSLAETASKVTMLQRSPTYLISAAKTSGPINLLRKVLPRKISHSIVRQTNALLEAWVWLLARHCLAKMPIVAEPQRIVDIADKAGVFVIGVP